MDFPDTLRYTENHEWVRLEDDGKTAAVGITDYAQGELGDIVFVDLEPEGSPFNAGEVFGSVEAVKTVSDLYMPVAGTIVAHNEAVNDDPELVNRDPYGEGWMVKIEVDDPADLDGLLSATDYSAHVA